MTSRPDPLDPETRRFVEGVANALTWTALALGLAVLLLGCIARWAL